MVVSTWMMAVGSDQELSMQAEASQRAWLERKDDGSRDSHTQDLGVLERNLGCIRQT